MRPRRYLATVILYALAVAHGRADEPGLHEAQRAFGQGVSIRGDAAAARQHFRHAARGYANAIWAEGYDTPGTRRMYGHSLLLAGEVSRAIHAYRSGLAINPDDEALRLGLESARTRVTYASPEDRAALTPRPDPLDWLRQPLRRWGIWAVAAFSIVAWFALHRWVLTRRPSWLATFIVSLAVVLLFAGGWIWDRSERHQAASQLFAVVDQSIILRRGDGSNFLPRRDAPLPPGAEVRIIGERPGWMQVELPDGTVGWLPSSSVMVPYKDGTARSTKENS